jgi:hypothetical protein
MFSASVVKQEVDLVGWGFEHPRFGDIQILDESSNLWLVEQQETENQFWISKVPKKGTKSHEQLMERVVRDWRFEMGQIAGAEA